MNYQLIALDLDETLLEEMDRLWLPVEKTWRLNEKHYGMLQGQNKQKAVQIYGEEQVTLWRRSYDVAPAPIPDDDPRHPKFDIRYQDIKYRAARPGTESLSDATRRLFIKRQSVKKRNRAALRKEADRLLGNHEKSKESVDIFESR